MGKTKGELLKDAQKAGVVPDTVSEDDYTAAQLETLLSGERTAWDGSMSAKEPVTSPDGHVALSQEDIDARDQ